VGPRAESLRKIFCPSHGAWKPAPTAGSHISTATYGAGTRFDRKDDPAKIAGPVRFLHRTRILRQQRLFRWKEISPYLPQGLGAVECRSVVEAVRAGITVTRPCRGVRSLPRRQPADLTGATVLFVGVYEPCRRMFGKEPLASELCQSLCWWRLGPGNQVPPSALTKYNDLRWANAEL